MYSSSDEEEALVFLLTESEEHLRQKKRKWVHDMNRNRREFGEFHTLMPELLKDPKRFFKYFRMPLECFEEILNHIKADVKKIDTNYREAITPEERLTIALRYLATGDSFITIGHSFRVGFETVSQIINEVCKAICKNMGNIYMPEPNSEIWKKSAEGFETVWQFPNCIGSIDGKHVTIKCPNKTGSNHFCYLNKFSIVLMAIVGPDYKFICVDIGGYGKNSDGGIFEASHMGQKFEAGRMDIPSDRQLPGQNEPCPNVLIGDEAFALRPYLMRPFPYRQARNDQRKEKFNKRLSKARRVVENAFGILSQKWRVFLRPMATKVDTTITVVNAACILHNFLITKKCEQVNEEAFEGGRDQIWFNQIHPDPRRATNFSFDVREKFVNYFNNS